MALRKLNLGSGNDPRHGYVNLDVAPLTGVDVVWDLEKRPWPFKDAEFDEILALDILEHLSDKIRPVEELWRISKPGAKIWVQVPNWNVEDMWVDPTHRQAYTHRSFDFFDPTHPKTKDRGYLSHARFTVIAKTFYVQVFGKTLLIRNPFFQKVISGLGRHFGSVLRAILFELETVK